MKNFPKDLLDLPLERGTRVKIKSIGRIGKILRYDTSLMIYRIQTDEGGVTTSILNLELLEEQEYPKMQSVLDIPSEHHLIIRIQNSIKH